METLVNDQMQRAYRALSIAAYRIGQISSLPPFSRSVTTYAWGAAKAYGILSRLPDAKPIDAVVLRSILVQMIKEIDEWPKTQS